MSGKKETPVSWLVQRLIDRQNQKDNPNFYHLLSLNQIYEKALEMESKKQQKYDEMLEMLHQCQKLTNCKQIYDEIFELIWEAKKL
jgi:hypothetical protein